MLCTALTFGALFTWISNSAFVVIDHFEDQTAALAFVRAVDHDAHQRDVVRLGGGAHPAPRVARRHPRVDIEVQEPYAPLREGTVRDLDPGERTFADAVPVAAIARDFVERVLADPRANWQRINDAVRGALEGITLAEMAATIL